MCVWCAYTGKKEAAPILYKMIKRIEGLWSGYYSGVVTQEGNALHMEKTEGCTRFWDEKYSISDFRGTCGLWHSRTNSGGNWKFAHPFVGTRGIVSTVSQGNAGYFAFRDEMQEKLINDYFKQGMELPSAEIPFGKKYCQLENGMQIHVSDFVTQLVEKEYLRTGNPIASIRFALTEFQEEASSIMIFSDIPGRIYFATTSQRILVARDEDGIVMSLTSIAFGKNPPKYTELPVNCVGYVDENEMHLEKLSPQFDNVYDRVPDGHISAMRNYLKQNGPSRLADICDNALVPLFPKQNCPRIRSTVAYRALEALYFDGEVEIVPEEVQNIENGIIGRADKIRLI